LEEIGQSNNLDDAAAVFDLLEREVERLVHAVQDLVLEPTSVIAESQPVIGR
jgi:hypothetical protein